MRVSIGIVRKIDSLGRIVVPMELRRRLNIDIKDSIEVFIDGDSIVLQKYEPSCVFCTTVEDTLNHKGKLVCKSCRQAISIEAKDN